MEDTRDFGRLWRRAIGIGAFGLFLAGLLVAIDLEELVLIAGVVAALCALAGAVTWLLVRFRRSMVHGVAAAGRATGPRFVRAGRGTGLAVAAGGAGAARATQAGYRRAVPALRRADEQLGLRVRAAAGGARRHAVHAFEVIAADIHTHREAARREARAMAARNPAVGRPASRRPAREPRRGRA
jgi:hypothetical protein